MAHQFTLVLEKMRCFFLTNPLSMNFDSDKCHCQNTAQTQEKEEACVNRINGLQMHYQNAQARGVCRILWCSILFLSLAFIAMLICKASFTNYSIFWVTVRLRNRCGICDCAAAAILFRLFFVMLTLEKRTWYTVSSEYLSGDVYFSHEKLKCLYALSFGRLFSSGRCKKWPGL